MNGPFLEVVPITVTTLLQTADGTALKQINGTLGNTFVRMDHFYLTNTDTVSHNVSIYDTNAAANLVGSVVVPAGAGVAGAANVDMVAAAGVFNGDPPCRGGNTWYIATDVALGAGKTIAALFVGGAVG